MFNSAYGVLSYQMIELAEGLAVQDRKRVLRHRQGSF